MKPELFALDMQQELLNQATDIRNRNIDENILFREVAKTGLKYGETYYWSPQICDVIGKAARLLKYPWTLVRESVPAPQGFFWFDKPPSEMILTGDEFSKFPLKLQAITWTLFQRDKENGGAYFISTEGVGPLDQSDGIVIQFYIRDPIDGSVVPNGHCVWSYGKTSRDNVMLSDDGRKGVYDDASEEELLRLGVLDNNVIGTCFQFLQQELFVADVRSEADRSTRKRLAKAWDSVAPWVRIVRLRRTRHIAVDGEKEGESREVEWSCQWLVRGHWRMQPYKKTGIVQPKWIAPYVKGPEDKPMHITETIFSVKD